MKHKIPTMSVKHNGGGGNLTLPARPVNSFVATGLGDIILIRAPFQHCQFPTAWIVFCARPPAIQAIYTSGYWCAAHFRDPEVPYRVGFWRLGCDR